MMIKAFTLLLKTYFSLSVMSPIDRSINKKIFVWPFNVLLFTQLYYNMDKKCHYIFLTVSLAHWKHDFETFDSYQRSCPFDS